MSEIIAKISDYIPKIGIMDFIEILIIAFVLYKILMAIKDTRAWVFLKGIIFLILFYVISDILGFHAIKIIFQSLFSVLLILLIVLFQQEIKKLLGEIGKKGTKLQFKLFKKEKTYEKLISDKNIEEIVKACKDMSASKTGALIVIERDLPLTEYSDTGIKIDAAISKQMLEQIFEKNTPLHDGAIIIHDNRIESATCYLPLTHNNEINKSLGTRHRAGIGISEVGDSLTVIVSEETGNISTAMNGIIHHGITLDELEKELKDIQKPKEYITDKNAVLKDFKIKFIAIIAAFAIWIPLINSADPVITKTLTDIPVTILNESKITDEGMSYQVIDGDKIDVVVSGKKSLVDKTSSTDIVAYADLANLSITDATEISVMCDISGITAEPKNKMLSVSIEDTKEVDYDVAVEQTGTLNSNNYISSIDLDKTSIKISGSISKIDIIGNVIAYVDITDAYNGKKITVTPTILDKNGNEMDLSNFTLDVEELIATVHMYKTKTVPLTISVQNTNDSGEITSYSYDKSEIIIAADDDTLEETSGIFIEIPVTIEEDINTSDFIKVVSLKELLPQGVYMAENDSKLSIEISYEKYEERTIELTNDDVTFVNKDGDYQYSLEDPIKVKVRGKSAQLDELSLKGIIDVEEKTDGTYNFDVELDSKYVVGNYKAVVLVEEREE